MIPVNMKSYSKHFDFIRNKAITAEIISLDPVKDHCRIVHLMTGYEFPWDVVRALEVALMRTFCSPCISGLLHRTGEFRKHGQKRYDDTALLVAEFMQNGYDNERGKFAVEHMNKIHRFYKIEKFVHEYESKNFICEDTNHAVGNATVNIVKGWMPFFAKPFVLPVMKCLLDEKMLKALGYSFPAVMLKVSVKAAMRLRALGLRKITFRKYPSFVTTEYNRTYPKGYKMEQLGPANLVNKL